jgi:hypothetical protein
MPKLSRDPHLFLLKAGLTIILAIELISSSDSSLDKVMASNSRRGRPG